MIKVLKLQKAIIAIILGIICLIVAQVMSSNRITGSSYLLGLSGFLLIIGAMLFLYPVLFAKKVNNDGDEVELKPIAKETTEHENSSAQTD